VESATFSPGGDQIVSGSEDKTVRVWDASSRAELAVMCGHESAAASVAFSPDGDRIVSGGDWDRTVRLWDARTGAEISVLRGHEYRVKSVVFSPDGDRIVSGSWDKTVRIWAPRSSACLEVIQGSGDVRAIAAGSQVFPLRALARGLETVVERADSGKPVASFPVSLDEIVTHPSGRIWAGVVGNYLCLITLD
jgi:WD40 repeat protein